MPKRPRRYGAASKQRTPDRRVSASRRGYGARWRRMRAMFLADPRNAICAECKRASANVVDHIVPHRGDPELYEDTSNWQGLCIPCHARKSAIEKHST